MFADLFKKSNFKALHLSFRWVLLLSFGLIHCEGPRYYTQSDLSNAQKQSTINVLILRHPLSYSGKNTKWSNGIDYDLLSDFSKEYHINLKFKSYQNEDDLLTAFYSGEGQIASGRFPRAFAESKNSVVGPDYESAALGVFCRSRLKVEKIDDLKSMRLIIFDKYKEVLPFKELSKKLPEALIQVWLNGTTLQAFQDIQNENADCLIGNLAEAIYHLREFKKIEFKLKLKDNFSLNWMIANEHAYLNPLLRHWFQEASRDGRISKIFDQYRIYSEELNSNDIEVFKQRAKNRLPEYKPLFLQASKRYGLPWELIAAISYQESNWDPSAKSFTGVQGLMQITKSTAKNLGIEDIHNPEENIFGGAKYIKKLMNYLPEELSLSDRIILALAAYNIGIGHLQDALNLTYEKKLNPYQWTHLKKTLPLLSDPNIYPRTQFGKARGYETVEYVEKTKAYFHFLLNH